MLKTKKLLTPMQEAIKALRRERGWTQVQLKDALQKTETTIRRWEIGVHEPEPDTMLRLAALTDDPARRAFFMASANPSGSESYFATPIQLSPTVEISPPAPFHTPVSPHTPVNSFFGPVPNLNLGEDGTTEILVEALKTILKRAPETVRREIADRLTRLAGTYGSPRGKKRRSR